jgi:TolA-binding protein
MTSKEIDILLMKELDFVAEKAGYIDEARLMLEDAFLAPSIPKKKRFVNGISVASAIAAAAAAVFIWVRPDGLDVTVGNDGRTLPEGAWVSSPIDEELALAFTDGSKIDMSKNTEVRVQQLKEEGAHLLLERGEVSVSVVHQTDTDWRIDAGPYKIGVTGTRFGVRWEPENKAFSVTVQEGTIDVDGPMLADGKSLSKGDNIRVSLLSKVVEIFKKDTYERIVSSDNSDTESHPLFTDDKTETQPSPSVDTPASGKIAAWDNKRKEGTIAVREEVESWKPYAASGRWAEAIFAAEKTGLRGILISSSLADLMLLGDAARLAKSYDLAMQVYRSVRSRFPGTAEAQRAAFTMGRIEFEAHGRYRDAAQWFQVCVDDNARGAMTREAYGRLVEALDKSGDLKGAQKAARTYLASFKHGPHAELAKQVLSEPPVSQ